MPGHTLNYSLTSFLAVLLSPYESVVAQSFPTAVDWDAYERGDLGHYPQVTFQSTDASAPITHCDTWSPKCDTSSYTLLSPRSARIRGNKALVLDSAGELVWTHNERGAVSNLQVQQYKGESYISMWVGDDDFYEHGHGYYKMVRIPISSSLPFIRPDQADQAPQFDQTYTLAYTISAGNDVDGDYHDFSITADDTALLTSYVNTSWDLSQFNVTSGFIWDCLFQEIDIESDAVLFEWRASDHFEFSDMAVNSWRGWTGTKDDPWDWLHLNGVQKDDYGNYMISARYTNAVSYINGKTGEFIWHLGGRNNSFIDMSEGNATRFVDPHMARWSSTNSTISLFDNAAFWTTGKQQRESHGLHLHIDTDTGVAQLLTDFVHPLRLFSESEGSMHLLENGNYLIGYGSKSVYSEYDSDGTLLCNTYYAPLSSSANKQSPKSGWIQSYRIYKQKWAGHPKEKPDVKIEHGTLYVSWNGATEVKSWKLGGRRSGNGWSTIGTFEKTGFETSMSLTLATSYQLTALDRRGRAIRAWSIHSEGDVWELCQDSASDGISHAFKIAVILVGSGLVLFLNRRHLTMLSKVEAAITLPSGILRFQVPHGRGSLHTANN